MAITWRPAVPQDVEGFVHRRRSLYPAPIHIQHHQLRHIITSPAQDTVYFATYNDVWRVDVATQHRELVTQLPFEPRCTASGHGYFCAGDEHGYVAWFKLPESNTSQSFPVDEALPAFTIGASNVGHPEPRVELRVEQLGSEIVNSISIHVLESTTTGPQTIMLTTNNDRVISFYSLTRGIGAKFDDYPFPMNHASISPDGQRMVAVGDHEFIYFYERIECKSKKPMNGRLQTLGFDFKLQHKFPLYKLSSVQHVAHFTTCWSQSGKLCATASEEGFVTVFDTKALDEADDVWSTVMAMGPSSRPGTIPGSIRTMTFAPDPWDLLIWTEDHGRVSIGDLRTNLYTRQVIPLDSKVENAKIIHLTESERQSQPSPPDVETNLDPVRRYRRDVQSDSLARYLTNVQDRRRLQRQGAVQVESPGLSEEEQQILEGLRTSRQARQLEDTQAALQHETMTALRRQAESQQEALNALRRHDSNSRPSPRSISYYPSTHHGRTDGLSYTGTEQDAHPSASGTSSGSELVRLQQYMRESRSSRRQAPEQPAQQRSRQPESSLPAVAPITSARDEELPIPPDPWQTIEAAMHRTGGVPASYAAITGQDAPMTPNEDGPPLNPATIPGALERRQALERREALMHDRDAMMAASLTNSGQPREADRANRPPNPALTRYDAALMRRASRGYIYESAVALRRQFGYHVSASEVIEWGSGTTGAAISDDGRSLYVGTEQGIFAFEMDFSSRKRAGKYEPA